MAVEIVLLAVGVAGAIRRPWRIPAWIVPLLCALVTIATGLTSMRRAVDAIEPLERPILFLLTAVPLAVLLDRLGFFGALAARLADGGHGAGRMWILAAAVTTLLNLDAAVVLLTPLYIGIARASGRDPLALAFQPVLLACLASSALPVSNLTNLIVASQTGATARDLVVHLALPSLVATTVGWMLYRRVLRPDDPTTDIAWPVSFAARAHPRCLVIGAAVVGSVSVAFVVGPSVGVEPWVTALAADVVLVAIVRDVPWRRLPLGSSVLTISLGVLAASAAAHLPVEQVTHQRGTPGLAVAMGAAALAANVMNNLPALLVALPHLHRGDDSTWAVLLGVNMGPTVLVTGSLASMLWLEAMRHLGVSVGPRDFARVGARVGLPAAACGAATLLVLSAVW